MIKLADKNQLRQKRQLRVRSKVSGTPSVPRLNVYRSSANIYAQLIDDISGTTLCSASTVAKGFACKGTKTECAVVVGESIAKAAIEKGITTVVFDRAGYLYTGRVKALAEAARNAGLKF